MTEKKPSLEQQIETFVDKDGIDNQWQDHFDVVAHALTTIGKMPKLNLLDPINAREAANVCSAKLSQLNQVLKQVQAVKTLAEEKKARGEDFTSSEES